MSSALSSGRRITGNAPALIVSLVICFAAAGVGSVAVNQTLQTWYTELRKPDWNPPNWVFGPVWTALYTAMAIAAWLVWKNRSGNATAARSALAWFGLQLALNTAWSFIFFGWRLPGWAFVEILALWVTILITILASWRVSRAAAILLVPYLLWVTFATSLNGKIWWLNS